VFAEPRVVCDPAECYFYHSLDLPEIGTVGGAWDLRGRFDDYIDHADLAGKTMLDVGTASGFLTFEAETRGGTVVSFDMDSKERQDFLPYRGEPWYEDKARYREGLNPGLETLKNGYWLAHRLFRSSARVFYGDIYALPEELGSFDVIVAGCIMMHLQNPILALESLSRVSSDRIIVIDTISPQDDERVAYLQSRADDATGHIIWWVYTLGLYKEVFDMLGYDVVGWAQNFYTCYAYTDTKGRPESREVLLSTLTARRRGSSWTA
jgi:hypothetical protein